MTWAEGYFAAAEGKPPWLAAAQQNDEENAPFVRPPLSKPAPAIDPNAGVVECSACGKTAFPSQELNPRMKLTPHCPECGREHSSVTSISVAKPDPRVVPVLAKQPSPTAPVDPVSMIRERLEFLDGEIARLAAYQKERTRLRRMLKAASR